jgi:hypothetical protein
MSNEYIYSFTGHPLTNGTLFRFSLQLQETALSVKGAKGKNTSANNLPQFYAGFRKWLRSNFRNESTTFLTQ